MTIFVQGMGWITKEGYGCIRHGLRRSFGNQETAQSLLKHVFSHPFKNFGRLDTISKTTAYAVAFALQDAGIGYSSVHKLDMGIIGTNPEGSLKADIEYFRDYVNGGRTLSRGNLFIYTLPSSPLGESAIHFGLQGPLLYVGARQSALLQVLDIASEMIVTGEASAMLAGSAEEDEGLFFVLSQTPAQAHLCTMATTRSVLAPGIGVAGVVQAFASLETEKTGS